jgi:hypothetical protein
VSSTGLRPEDKPKPWTKIVVLNRIRPQQAVKRYFAKSQDCSSKQCFVANPIRQSHFRKSSKNTQFSFHDKTWALVEKKPGANALPQATLSATPSAVPIQPIKSTGL